MCVSIKCEGNCLIPTESVMSNSSNCGKRKTWKNGRCERVFLYIVQTSRIPDPVEINKNKNGTEILENEIDNELPWQGTTQPAPSQGLSWVDNKALTEELSDYNSD